MIVAIVGNAAEHGGAVVVAHRGKIKLAAEIALASSAQVAVFLIPAVALLAWSIDPLALSFRPVEIVVLGGSVVFTARSSGTATRAAGAASPSIAAYVRARGGVLPRRRPLGSVNRNVTTRATALRLCAEGWKPGLTNPRRR